MKTSPRLAGTRRRAMAAGLRRRLDEADTGSRTWSMSSQAPFDCRQVRSARRQLTALSERLEGQAPVSARGLALVELILTDPAGPLYAPTEEGELARVAAQALAALDSPEA